MTKTRLRPITHHNSRVNGYTWRKEDFAELEFDHPGVYADPGPSPAGNSGPYLHVPALCGDERVIHRVYPRRSDVTGARKTERGWCWVVEAER